MAREKFEFEAVDMGRVHKDAPVKKFMEKKTKVCKCMAEEAEPVEVKTKQVEEKPKSKRPEKGSDEAKAWAQKMREARLAKKTATAKPEES